MRVRSLPLLLLLACLALPSMPTLARADDIGGLDEAPLIRKQLLLRGGRHEITAGLGISLGDAFVRGYAPSVSYQFHLFNWFSVGADFSYNLCAVMADACKTGLTEEIEASRPNFRDYTAITYIAAPYVSLVPVSGKLGLVGGIIANWDMHLILGLALVGEDNVGSGGEITAETNIGPVLGIGQRFYLSDSLAITVSLRDYLISRKLNAATHATGAGQEEVVDELEHRFFLTISGSFFFPGQIKTGQ